MEVALDRSAALRPFLPRLTIQWIVEQPDLRVQAIDGTVVFVDISGFTKMSERLARNGRIGAEEVTDVVGDVFSLLLATAYANGGGLIKFGGDALLLFFSGADHAPKAVRAAAGMRRTLSELGGIDTSAGKVRLRMSVGIHSGLFHFFLVGERHRELIMTGAAASTTVAMEGTADAGEIVVSPDTAALINAEQLAAPKGDGILLRRQARISVGLRGFEPPPQPVPAEVDLTIGIPVALRDLLVAGSGDAEHRQRHDRLPSLRRDRRDLLVAQGPEVLADGLQQLVGETQAAVRRARDTVPRLRRRRRRRQAHHDRRRPEGERDGEERMLRALRRMSSGLRDPVPDSASTGARCSPATSGPPYRRTYTVMGDAVNLAASVMAKAIPARCWRQARSSMPPTSVRDPGARALHGEGQALTGDGVRRRADRRRARSIPTRTIFRSSGAGGDRRDRTIDGGRSAGPRPHARDRRPAGDRQDAAAAPSCAGRRRGAEITTACDLYSASTPYAPFREIMLAGARPRPAGATESRMRREPAADQGVGGGALSSSRGCRCSRSRWTSSVSRTRSRWTSWARSSAAARLERAVARPAGRLAASAT